MTMKSIRYLFLFIFLPLSLLKAETHSNYFASIKSDEVNVRTGPNVRYPIQWVYVKKGEPVQVIAVFEEWRKIVDQMKNEGWVHRNMLSKKRTVIITGKTLQHLNSSSSSKAKTIAALEPGVRAELVSCSDGWCQIKVSGKKGWTRKTNLWGVGSK
jgi:SH3-like domain-containing protein